MKILAHSNWFELTFCVDKSNPRKVCLSSGIIFKSFLSNLNFIYSKSINLYPAGITDTIYLLLINNTPKNIRLSKIFLVKYQLYYCTFHSYARQMLNGLIHKVETVTFFPFIVSLMILFIYYTILLFTVFAIWMKFHTNTDTLTHVHFLTDVNSGGKQGGQFYRRHLAHLKFTNLSSLYAINYIKIR